MLRGRNGQVNDDRRVGRVGEHLRRIVGRRNCEDLEALVAQFERITGRQFEVLQVKEKLGGLRFYVNCRNDAIIRHRIGIAADESFRTCEVCGQPGTLREDRLIKTLCDEHDASGQGETVMAELSKRATSGTHERS